MSDRRVTTVAVQECGERLVNIREHGAIQVDLRKQDTDGAFAFLREGVLERLLHAQTLLPDGTRLLFIEGYRPPALQRRYFEEYADQLRRSNPDWQPEQVREAASRFVSPPEIAPHSAGAAVDVTLVDRHGHEMDMGTRVNASPEESNGACYTAASTIDAQARANRDTLGRALSAAGLINYGTEWWHWSWGDRYWALMAQRPSALYGPVELPQHRTTAVFEE
ncbi:M15 family metallopeptidase [Streptomyces sp. NPDC058268]|uniref:M15 family metallopeptidase n=1 Tax=Streptomyces sp. NPDC058268 TaxID=3346413 RepID=UPI0036EC2166